MDKLKEYIPKDRYKQFARYGHWKACILNSGEVELYNVHDGAGISEQTNVAVSNKETVKFITDYLQKNRITATYINIQ